MDTMALPGGAFGGLAGVFNGTNTLGGTRKLTIEVLQKLSAGAVKLFAAHQLEPNASRKRYEEITGYKERHMRNLTRELEEAGLMPKLPYHKDEVSPEMRGAYEKIIALGVHSVAALRLVGRHPLPHIMEGVALVSAQKDRLKNPPGYLITWLDGKINEPANPATQDAAPVGQPTIVQAVVQSVSQPVAQVQATPPTQPTTPAKAKRKAAPKTQAAQAEAPKAEAAKTEATTTTAIVPQSPAAATELVVDEKKRIMDLLAANPRAAKLAYALENATGCDIRLNQAARHALDQLYHAGYTHEDVTYYLAQHWPKTWQGRKGEPLTLPLLMEGIARSKHALEMSAFDKPGEALAERFAIIDRVAQQQGTPPTLEDVHEHILKTNARRIDVLSRYLTHPRYTAQAQNLLDELRADMDADRDARHEAEAQLAAHIEALPRDVRRLWTTTCDLISMGRDAGAERYVKQLQVFGYDPVQKVMTLIVPTKTFLDRLDRGLRDVLIDHLNRAWKHNHPKTTENQTLSIEVVVYDEVLSAFGY